MNCDWCLGDSLYEEYQDMERGVPCFDDCKLFEFVTDSGTSLQGVAVS